MDLGQIFKDLIWNVLVKAALGRLFAAIPLLGWGPIGLIVTWIVSHFAEKLFDHMHEWIDFKMIFFKKKELQQAFDGEVLKLQGIFDEKGMDSDEFKAQREKSKEALSKFVKFNIPA